ncbi:hypothetical protein JCM5353_002383 [Sporobolomyces roseus]
MADKMDPQITLTTSDNPPVSLTISRSALVAQSKVFADMLSLSHKSEDGDHSIPVVETEDQLRPFSMVIEGSDEEREGALSALNERGWINLAKLADKYDSWAVRKSVEEKAWSVLFILDQCQTESKPRIPREINTSKSNPKLAFALATICQNKKLIQATARPVVLLLDLEAYPNITSDWRIRLAAWKGAQLDKIMRAMSAYATNRPYHNTHLCDLDGCDGERCWNRLVGRALIHYDLEHSPPIPVRDELLHVSMCDRSIRNFVEKAAKFEKETSEWIEFPV